MAHADHGEGNITFFTTCVNFEPPFDVTQFNAIRSWGLEGGEILVIGEADGAAAAARELGFRYLPETECMASSVPYLEGLYAVAEANASYDLICYVNSDIILIDFAEALRQVAGTFEQFLMIGQRHNTNIEGRLDFSEGWETRLRALVRAKGALDAPCAVDYFASRKGLYPEIPPFVIGRYAWDNWLVWNVLCRGIPVVDVTPVVMAVHQSHPMSKYVDDPDCVHNRQLFADLIGHALSDLGSVPTGFVTHSDWILDEGGLRSR